MRCALCVRHAPCVLEARGTWWAGVRPGGRLVRQQHGGGSAAARRAQGVCVWWDWREQGGKEGSGVHRVCECGGSSEDGRGPPLAGSSHRCSSCAQGQVRARVQCTLCRLALVRTACATHTPVQAYGRPQTSARMHAHVLTQTHTHQTWRQVFEWDERQAATTISQPCAPCRART